MQEQMQERKNMPEWGLSMPLRSHGLQRNVRQSSNQPEPLWHVWNSLPLQCTVYRRCLPGVPHRSKRLQWNVCEHHLKRHRLRRMWQNMYRRNLHIGCMPMPHGASSLFRYLCGSQDQRQPLRCLRNQMRPHDRKRCQSLLPGKMPGPMYPRPQTCGLWKRLQSNML